MNRGAVVPLIFVVVFVFPVAYWVLQLNEHEFELLGIAILGVFVLVGGLLIKRHVARNQNNEDERRLL